MIVADTARLGTRDRIMWALATGGGLGMASVAPGTFGTLPGFVLVGLIEVLPSAPARVAALTAAALLAVPIASWGERFFQSKDPSPVVIDEVIGLPITAAFAPASIVNLCLAFLLNRALDIAKPPPARQSQRLPAGWGIVIDDVISSIYAGLLLWAFNRVLGPHLAAALPSWLTRALTLAP